MEYDGNLRVVTPGFDESEYDDLEYVGIITIEFNDDKKRCYSGRHKKSKGGEKAVIVNFDWLCWGTK
ncbi:hypothetical protein KAR91_62990 [Candidatus Pacearchaeota archaeon]|nr:hypothetical protein [Candidatus Pacearchaeota archaeon]